MIARVLIQLPFECMLPEGVEYSLYTRTEEHYQITFQLPVRNSADAGTGPPSTVEVDGKPAIRASILVVDFAAVSFNRDEQSLDFDPPLELIARVVNDFLTSLRTVTGASWVKPLGFPHLNWEVRYLDDERQPLAEEDGKIRRKGVRQFKVQHLAITPKVWEDLHDFDPSDVQVWQTLLLDSAGALPEVGPAIVLAATAIEVFIAQTLDRAVEMGAVSKEMWSWISDRDDDYRKQPSVGEQLDVLSRLLLGRSLKESSELWSAFKQLRQARNAFVHDGTAVIGKSKRLVGEEEAATIISNARRIIEWISDGLPEERRPRRFKHDIRITSTHIIIQPERPAADSDASESPSSSE